MKTSEERTFESEAIKLEKKTTITFTEMHPTTMLKLANQENNNKSINCHYNWSFKKIVTEK